MNVNVKIVSAHVYEVDVPGHPPIRVKSSTKATRAGALLAAEWAWKQCAKHTPRKGVGRKVANPRKSAKKAPPRKCSVCKTTSPGEGFLPLMFDGSGYLVGQCRPCRLRRNPLDRDEVDTINDYATQVDRLAARQGPGIERAHLFGVSQGSRDVARAFGTVRNPGKSGKALAVGDLVRYSAKFLKSTGQYTRSPVNGRVIESPSRDFPPAMAGRFVKVEWSDGTVHNVNVANLSKVGQVDAYDNPGRFPRHRKARKHEERQKKLSGMAGLAGARLKAIDEANEAARILGSDPYVERQREDYAQGMDWTRSSPGYGNPGKKPKASAGRKNPLSSHKPACGCFGCRAARGEPWSDPRGRGRSGGRR